MSTYTALAFASTATAGFSSAPRRNARGSSPAAVSPAVALNPTHSRPIRSRRAAVVTNAGNQPIYGNTAFAEWVGGAFPEEGIADPDEGRVLWDLGYDILDLRAESEVDHMGKIPNPQRGQVQEFIVMGPDKVRHVPFINAVRKYNSEMGAKEYVQTPDVELFKQRITKVFPNKDAKIMVACSDGRKRSPAALDILDGMGYTNIVGLKGGANLWMRTWDKKLKRRDLPGEYCSDYSTPGDIQQFAVGIGSRAINAGDAHVYDDLHDTTPWKV